MIRLLIFGPTGSMGKLISKLALDDREINVVAACDVSKIGEELALFAGTTDPNNIKISDVNNLIDIIAHTKPNVAVDFTIAHATEKNCLICAENGIRCVIGTTALSQEFFDKYKELIKIYHTPAVFSPNMATGVNVLFKIASVLTKYLADWDIEVIEAHHNRKQDNYSGTSLKILDIICETIGSKKEDITKYGRTRGKFLREKGAKNEIGIHCIRAGDIVGEHKILYAGSGENIELKHSAIDRNCFATGAIRAIKFIGKQKEDKIFEMKDVLNL
ncbi:MAG: 4-hydroxy-tetrahydrodipicolinate reductase [Candidatus Thorarchaeota archaeon]